MNFLRESSARNFSHVRRSLASVVCLSLAGLPLPLAAETSAADELPQVEHVGFAGPQLLELRIQDGRVEYQSPQPYVALPGDQIKEEGKRVLVWDQGKLVEGPVKRALVRDGKPVGLMVGGRSGPPQVLMNETRLGAALDVAAADAVASYRITSRDDSAYAAGLTPTAVHRKSKPNNRVMPEQGQTIAHQLFLELPKPLQPGKTYTVELPGLQVVPASTQVIYNTRQTRSSAVHASQIGYRPDDPFKRAFLSLWLGTGAAHTFDDVANFELLNDADAVVFEGSVEELLAVDGQEMMRPQKNFSQTAVYGLDFSKFQTPGTYRVHVPGVGTSEPFEIADGVWKDAFRKSMHGFLAQRSGLELGPPFTDFVRPRDLHPADGVVVYRSTASVADAFEVDSNNWFSTLVAGRTDEEIPGAWGGYHDAGDFDRAANHLWATYLHLELLDLFPDYFGKVTLALPADEAGDDLPDVLNEALWNVSLFLRLQTSDGGVGGGLEASDHPRAGEASFNDSLAWFAYAPDVLSSYTYAAVAARTARLLSTYDSAAAQTYQDSAIRAWQWAEQHVAQASDKGYQAFKPEIARTSAAVELLWLTGDAAYDEAFTESNQLGESGQLIDEQGAAFAYARLPEGLGNADLKAKARERLVRQAKAALDYAADNAFGLTSEIADLPLIGPVGAFTTPGMLSQILPRVHYLTGDKRYLSGAVRACNFSAGANPDNMTMTTGVGAVAPKAPLHFDGRYNAQEAPTGLTVYGAYDAESLPSFAKSSEWVHKWYLGKTTTPDSKTWPATEGYFDFFLWPMMNEFTIRQNMGPTSFYWGYLAARADLKP